MKGMQKICLDWIQTNTFALLTKAVIRLQTGYGISKNACRRKSLALALIPFLAVTTSCAQPAPKAMELTKTIAVKSTDDPNYAHLSWSPLSLAWSPDGKRIAYTSTGLRRFGVIDIETGKNTEIVSDVRGGADVLWGQQSNLLVVLHSTEFIVFDMSQEPAKQLYAVQNKMPKLLSTHLSGLPTGGAGIVSLQGKDVLVLMGTTSWRLDSSNPHITVYDLQTGQRLEQFNYQFKNEPYEGDLLVSKNGTPGFQPSRAKVGLNRQGEILATVYSYRATSIRNSKSLSHKDPSSTPHENAVVTVNLNTKKIICQYESPQNPVNEAGETTVYTNHYLAGNSKDEWFVYSNYAYQAMFNAQTCEKRMDIADNVGSRKDGIAYAERFKLSPDGQWLFGFNYNAHEPKKAPFKLWRLSDGKLIHNDFWHFDDGVADGEFSPDSKRLAWATTDGIKIYSIKP